MNREQVTGMMENLFEDVYKRFPWIVDIDNMLSDNMSTWSTPEGEPNETIGAVLEFVAHRAYTLGNKGDKQ